MPMDCSYEWYVGCVHSEDEARAIGKRKRIIFI